MKHLLASVILFTLFSAYAFTQDKSSNSVVTIAICTSVGNRQPVGTDSVFSSNVGKLYCFTKLKGQAEESVISHVWIFEGKEMAKIDLKMKANMFRTWSAKTILPEWKGSWSVEVRDADGNKLRSISFKVQ